MGKFEEAEEAETWYIPDNSESDKGKFCRCVGLLIQHISIWVKNKQLRDVEI